MTITLLPRGCERRDSGRLETRIPLRWAVGDRCVALDALAVVEEIFPREHPLYGGVRVRFARWSTAIVPIGSLECVGFTRFAGAT